MAENRGNKLTSQQVLDFLLQSREPAGKCEIARAFGLKGQKKIALKALLKEMAEKGLIKRDKGVFYPVGRIPHVTTLKVTKIEDDGVLASPENWKAGSDAPPSLLKVRESKKHHTALKVGDRILARTEQRGTGWVAHIMKKLPSRHEQMLGVVEVDGAGKAWLAPVDRRIKHAVQIADMASSAAGNLVFAETVSSRKHSGVNVTEVLGDPLSPNAFSLISIVSRNIPHVFSEDVLAQADQMAAQPINQAERKDLRDLPLVTIDPSDARDHDDAIWAEPDGKGGFHAVIAIADVSYYVRPGSALDREARKRGNSVYFPDRVVPMLPSALSADACSLTEGEDRAALTCHLNVSSDGKITNYQFFRSLVRVAKSISYTDVQRLIDTQTAESYLVHLWDCWRALDHARAKRDPLDLDLPERRIVLDDKGQVSEITLRERLDAHKVVEEFMIAANVAAAKALESRVMPVVYRLHEPPARDKLVSFKEYLATFGRNFALGQVIRPESFNKIIRSVSEDTEKPMIMEAVLRTQTQAYYGTHKLGHFGLALDSYVHFTSPIRRYADLLIHRSLVDAFKLDPPNVHTGLSDFDRADLGHICEVISGTERRAIEAERETSDRYLAAWLASHIGEIFSVRITGVHSFGFFVTIIGTGGDGLVPVSGLGDERFRYDATAQTLTGSRTETQFAVGDKMDLRLASANPLTGSMTFELLEATDARPATKNAGFSAKPGKRRTSGGKAKYSARRSRQRKFS